MSSIPTYSTLIGVPSCTHGVADSALSALASVPRSKLNKLAGPAAYAFFANRAKVQV